jgi:RHS repeat-associated protein
MKYPKSIGGLRAYTETLRFADSKQLNWGTSCGYDTALRKTSETNARSQVLQFICNAADDLRTLVDGKNLVTKSSLSSQAGTFTCTYYGGGAGTSSSRLYKKLALPNGAYITNAYDNVARLTDTALKNSSNTILNDHSYLYNAGSQRTRQTRTDGSYVSYTYDNIGQLTGVRTTNSAGSEIAAERFGYLYDAAWNLNQKTNNTTVTVYSVDNRNQLTTCAGQSCTYDSNGNLTFQTIASRNYTYDDENQLVETDQSANSRTDLIYDGRMRLRKRVESTWNGSSWVQSSETRYLYDGMRVIQERDSSNTPTVSYTRGMDLSGTFEGAGGIGGLLARSSGYSAGAWSTNHYYHADGSGNITALVDSTQAISATYKYEPFGRTISSSGTMAVQNVYRFSSKEWLTGSGMYYYGFRVYEPSLQRWLNRDPLSDLGHSARRGLKVRRPWRESNLYSFVGNEPTDSFDALGLEQCKPDTCAQDQGQKDELQKYLDSLSKEAQKRIKEKLAEAIGADIDEAKAACDAIACPNSQDTLGNSWDITCQQCAALKCALDVTKAAAFEQCIKGTFAACLAGVPPDKLKVPKVPDVPKKPKL